MTLVVDDVSGNSIAESRRLILEWEKFALTHDQVEIPVKHYIHGNMYGREITIPKGTLITGQLYKFDHFDIMISGDISVSTDCGERKRLKGYNVFCGLSGKKRAGYAHEDTTWITFHPAKGSDGEEIQRGLTVDTFEELEQFYLSLDNASYLDALDAIGISEEVVHEQVHNTEDLITMPECFSNVYIAESAIHGTGLYSSFGHEENSVVCLTRVGVKRTIAGRYANHSHTPNCKMQVMKTGDVLLVSLCRLAPNTELTVNYLDVVNHRAEQGDLCPE